MPCSLHAVLYTNCADWHKKCGRYRNSEGLPGGSVYMTDFCYPGLSRGSNLFFKRRLHFTPYFREGFVSFGTSISL